MHVVTPSIHPDDRIDMPERRIKRVVVEFGGAADGGVSVMSKRALWDYRVFVRESLTLYGWGGQAMRTTECGRIARLNLGVTDDVNLVNCALWGVENRMSYPIFAGFRLIFAEISEVLFDYKKRGGTFCVRTFGEGFLSIYPAEGSNKSRCS
jgi:hypothetical protein